MFFREGTLLNPSRSSPWSWFWWCSLHWRLCWCCPSCRYPQDDHCGWRVSRVNGKYTKSRPGTIARINLFREQVLNCKVGYFDYIYIYRWFIRCWKSNKTWSFLSYSPRLHNPRRCPSRGQFYLGKNAGRCSLVQLASMLPFLSLLWWHLFGLGSPGLWWKSVWRLWGPQDLRHFIYLAQGCDRMEFNQTIKSLMKVG